MAWTLAGNALPSPQSKNITYDVREITHRTLGGKYVREFVGNGKEVIEAIYSPLHAADYNTILGHYQDQQRYGHTKLLVVDELGFSGNVHIFIEKADFVYNNHYDWRNFKVKYIQI